MTKYLMISFLAMTMGWCWGQNTVLPGDANANGRVDQYDLPFIGYAYGSVGPARITLEDVTLSGIPQGWAAAFANGPNYAHADANGNGAVEFLDFITWSQNYGAEHTVVTPLNIPTAGQAAVVAPIWNNHEIVQPVTGGTALALPISFDVADDQLVNGMAYRIRYNPDHFESVTFLAQNNWLTAGGNGVSMQKSEQGSIHIGSTRFGVDPVLGGGTGGTLAIVIITDMVDLLETAPDTLTTWLVVENVLMVNADFEAIPTRSDSLAVKLYRPGIISDTRDILKESTLFLYPNPTTGALWLQTQYPVHEIMVMDVLGQVVRRQSTPPTTHYHLPDLALPPGYYVLYAHGDNHQTAAPFIIR